MKSTIHPYKKRKKKVIRSIVPALLLISFLLPLGNLRAQLILSSETDPNKKATDAFSVRMTPGFKVTPVPGSLFHAFIDANGDGIADSQQSGILPSSTENYIKTTEYLTENGESGDKKVFIVYFDGLGREKQAVVVAATPQGKDLLTHYEYDGFGRQAKDYLPVPSNGSSGSLVTDPLSLYNQYYGNPQTYNTQYYYSQKELENSPLNRMLKQGAPGDSWKLGSGHEVKFSYQTNVSNEVRLFRVGLASGYVPALSDAGYYPASELYKSVTKNENWKESDGKNNTTEEFKDKEGKVILKRTYNNSLAHDTYYVYDIYGNLTYVLPPMLSDKPVIAQALLDDLGYQYQYDERNRLVEKQLPGKGREYLVYDKQDRLVASQDAKLRETGHGIFTKYDKFGRVIITGFVYFGTSRSAAQAVVNTKGNNSEERSASPLGGLAYYTNDKAYPSIQAPAQDILTLNYYDSYENTNTPLISSVEGQEVVQSGINLKGLPTVSYAKKLDASWGEGNWSYTLYDTKARPVRTLSKNYLGGFTQTDSKLNYFRGRTEYTLTKHSRASQNAEVTIKEEFTYDRQERLLAHTHQLNGGSVEYLAQNAYDELGQLKNKKVGGMIPSQGLQQVDYQYNIRGWLTDINNLDNLTQPNQPKDLFAFKISYDRPLLEHPDFPALYNGNISETLWKSSTDNIKRQYNYFYDSLNRLEEATYTKNYDPNTGSASLYDAYNESQSYDKNGNITFLGRTGDQDISNNFIHIDNLVYTYKANSNQLLAVKDNSNHPSGFKDGTNSGNDYTYDSNGNMTQDLNKKINVITYNYLNLPTKITFADGNYIEYLYDASGAKMQKQVKQGSQTTTTLYLGGFQYLDNQLQFFPQAEGYVKKETDRYSYVYNYTDHLGNVRLSYSDDNKDGIISSYNKQVTQTTCVGMNCTGTTSWVMVNEVLEENNYYPFGLKHSGYNENGLNGLSTNGYNYKYNGKELQSELNLNVYDYGARMYMPDIGRWGVVDPLAEKSRRFSPYTYALNNPVYFIDPDGMLVSAYDKSDGWIKKGDDVFFDANVNTQEQATETYGKSAEYVGSSGQAVSYDAETGAETDRINLNADGTISRNDNAGTLNASPVGNSNTQIWANGSVNTNDFKPTMFERAIAAIRGIFRDSGSEEFYHVTGGAGLGSGEKNPFFRFGDTVSDVDFSELGVYGRGISPSFMDFLGDVFSLGEGVGGFGKSKIDYTSKDTIIHSSEYIKNSKGKYDSIINKTYKTNKNVFWNHGRFADGSKYLNEVIMNSIPDSSKVLIKKK